MDKLELGVHQKGLLFFFKINGAIQKECEDTLLKVMEIAGDKNVKLEWKKYSNSSIIFCRKNIKK